MLKEKILTELKSVSKKEKEEIFQRFFKTGKGEYGEGDIFAGITVPEIRSISKRYYKEMTLEEVEYFVQHKIHEYRLFGLLTLTYMWKKADEVKKKTVFNLYIKNLKYINNWDLVDLSAPSIVGEYLKEKDRTILYDLAKSNDLWKQRVAILSTFSFLREKDFVDTLHISEILLHHKHDLIHKAVGWMLREIGKRDQDVEEEFLKKYYKEMPRTMLGYAIERFEEEKRQKYLKGLV
ncbi:MAG TPA: DNA alkylation repair protein [Candidatus Dojkabacteria bacterium]|nr:DNA alkylation repair protein [Candidatus Dojkabacteria bacterium]